LIELISKLFCGFCVYLCFLSPTELNSKPFCVVLPHLMKAENDKNHEKSSKLVVLKLALLFLGTDLPFSI